MSKFSHYNKNNQTNQFAEHVCSMTFDLFEWNFEMALLLTICAKLFPDP